MSATDTVTPRAGSPTTGMVLFAALTGWIAVTAVAAGSSGGSIAALILSSGLMLLLSGIAASRWPLLVPAALVGAAMWLVFGDLGATFRSGPLQGPFGYANATAAFLVQATVGALMLVVAGPRVARVVGVTAVVAFAVVIFITRSWTAVILFPVVLGTSVIVERARGSRTAIAVSGGLFAAILFLTVAIGAWGPAAERGSFGDVVVRGTISHARVALWHDALALMLEEPLLGVGPGRFGSESSTASSDEDLRWAHNEFLQTGAETGFLGSALAVGIFLWGFAALWLGPPSRLVALAAVALALLGIHASVDYVLHFPAVALAGAAVLGTGLGAHRHRSRHLDSGPPSARVSEGAG